MCDGYVVGIIQMVVVDDLVIFMVFICYQYYVVFFCLYYGVGYCFCVVFYYFCLICIEYVGQNIVDNCLWFFGVWVIVSYDYDVGKFFCDSVY